MMPEEDNNVNGNSNDNLQSSSLWQVSLTSMGGPATIKVISEIFLHILRQLESV